MFFHQITSTSEWAGGVYASPTLAGSRPGANIAVTWAAMMSFGRDGAFHSAKLFSSFLLRKVISFWNIFDCYDDGWHVV